MKNTNVLLLLVTLIVASACQNKNAIQTQQRPTAPKSQADTGLVVENANLQEVEAALEANPQARVRVLSEKHGIFEFFGIAQEELAKYLSQEISRNQFFTSTDAGGLPPKASIFSTPGPEGVQLPGMNRCRKAIAGTLSPTAILSVAEPAIPLNFATIDISQKIKVNSKLSVSSKPGGVLKKAIVILPPAASAHGETIEPGDEFEFTPDAMGLYQIVTVVQEADDTCSMDGVAFLVTANRPYLGTSVPDVPVDLARMSHLSQVQAEESWALSEGEGQIIAILDSGVNYNHPVLASQIQLNEKDLDTNDQDEDENGFTNDVLGWDFVNSDAFPYDDVGHGSHVAGLAAGKTYGLARKAKILPVKVMSELGGDIGSIASGIRYAVDRGARILNLSLGGEAAEEHPLIISAVKYAESKGALLVIAAGNGDPNTGVGFSIDDRPVFPAALPDTNILSVGACDRVNTISPYSNFGKVGVDLTAPGGWVPFDSVVSATQENAAGVLFVGMNGTSMAAPIAAGIAAQVLSLRPSLTYSELRDILMSTGVEKPDLKDTTVSGRQINALNALQSLNKPALLAEAVLN